MPSRNLSEVNSFQFSVFKGLDRGMEVANFPVFAESCVKPMFFLITEN
jgi:hypothetical protein